MTEDDRKVTEWAGTPRLNNGLDDAYTSGKRAYFGRLLFECAVDESRRSLDVTVLPALAATQ